MDKKLNMVMHKLKSAGKPESLSSEKEVLRKDIYQVRSVCSKIITSVLN